MGNSASNLTLNTMLKGLFMAGSALMSVYLAKKYTDSMQDKEKVFSQFAALIQKEGDKLISQSQQKETQQETGNDNQQIFNGKPQRKEGAPGNILDFEFTVAKQMETNKQMYKICITGGPCAGKTSGLVLVAEKLFQDGF